MAIVSLNKNVRGGISEGETADAEFIHRIREKRIEKRNRAVRGVNLKTQACGKQKKGRARRPSLRGAGHGIECGTSATGPAVKTTEEFGQTTEIDMMRNIEQGAEQL